MMFVVVPAEELGGPSAGILLAAEAVRIIRTVLQGFPGTARQGRCELRFGERIIVGDMRAGVGLGDTQIGQEQGHRFRSHRTPAVSMDRELLRLNVLADTGSSNQFLGQAG